MCPKNAEISRLKIVARRVANVIAACFTILFCAVVLIPVCTRIAGEQRARRYFRIPGSQPVNVTTIRSAILSQVPPGSSVTQVHAYLEQAGIGKDESSGYGDSLVSEKPQIRAEVDHGTTFACEVEFRITFFFADTPLGRDARNNVIVLPHEDRLKEIVVEDVPGACL